MRLEFLPPFVIALCWGFAMEIPGWGERFKVGVIGGFQMRLGGEGFDRGFRTSGWGPYTYTGGCRWKV